MLSTGMDTLDRRLRGGLAPGTLLAFTAPPETQAELLVESVARANDTAYLTTLRDSAVVAERLPEASVTEASPEELLATPAEYLTVPDGGCLVVDAVTGMERNADAAAYRDFLEAAADAVREAGGLLLLFGHESETEPTHRWLSYARADMTWRLSLVINPLAVETRLAVTKNREGSALVEPLKLRLTDHVLIDTSRDI